MVKGEPFEELPRILKRQLELKNDQSYILAIALAENIFKQYAQILQIENFSEIVEQWKKELEEWNSR